jgi:succinate dehydrogenase flavin-adding protein (antitoxin of CptAB toxin-antitoxin module)
MKELDLLLQGWLEQRYAAATPTERRAFEGFLELPDPQIAAYLLGREQPTDPGLAALLAQLSPARA